MADRLPWLKFWRNSEKGVRMRDLSLAARGMLHALLELSEDDGSVPLTPKQIANDIAKDVRTISKLLAELEAARAIHMAEGGIRVVANTRREQDRSGKRPGYIHPDNAAKSNTCADQEGRPKKVRDSGCATSAAVATKGSVHSASSTGHPARARVRGVPKRVQDKMFPQDAPLPEIAGGRIVRAVLDRCNELLGSHANKRWPGFDKMIVAELEANSASTAWVEAILFPTLAQLAGRVQTIESHRYFVGAFRQQEVRTGYAALSQAEKERLAWDGARFETWRKRARSSLMREVRSC